MKALELALKQQPVVYVTLDIERALGISPTTEDYYIVANFDPFSSEIAKTLKNILLIKGDTLLSTRELLEHPKTLQFIKKINNPHILVFKNTLPIEEFCKNNNWPLLNPSTQLATTIEEKISQITWLGPLAKLLPPHEVKPCKKIIWKDKKFILQFNSAHTGNGTYLVESKEQLEQIQQKFPDRPVRLFSFIQGPTFTNNNVIWNKKVLIGSISYQITGLEPFTNRPFATIGNDWALPDKLLSEKQQAAYTSIAEAVGKRLIVSGWKGLFGIDVIEDEKTGKLYLIEINARQPASTTCESQLQETKNSLTTFEAHLASLLKLNAEEYELTPLHNGAQVVKRIIDTEPNILLIQKKKLKEKLEAEHFKTIVYNNKNPGSESLRIQSTKGIMKQNNEFNELGKKIIQCLK